MKRVLLFLSLVTCALQGFAQLNGDGYYRVQSYNQHRYVSVVDNRGSINVSTTSADMSALRTILGFERVVSDPSTIIYFKKMNSGYDLQSQGTGSYAIISHELSILSTGEGTYWAYASKGSLTKYLADEEISWMWADNDPRRIYGDMTAIGPPPATSTAADWYILPVSAADNDNYFGITPTVSAGDAHYQTFYASFPFTFSSAGMTAYYVSLVDRAKAAVVIKEITGGVPSATPVIIKCASKNAADNRLNVGAAASGTAAGNLLNGVYFCNDVEDPGHRNVKAYDPATMRVLGKAEDGSLAFVKSNDLQYIPANTAYIMVPADSPDELKVYSQEEYDQLPEPVVGPTAVDITVNSFTRKYGEANPEFTYTISTQDVDLTGLLTVVCDANEKSGVGEYPITVVCSSEDYEVVCIPGTLTVTPALLAVTAQNAQRLYGAENPALSYTVQGFVNNETEAVLTEKPVVATEATKSSAAGTYDITVSGGKAANYIISNYYGGTLTVNKASLTVKVNDATRTYGANNPTFTYSISGFVNNETEAVLTTKPSVVSGASSTSEVGNYVIRASGAVAANYNFSYADGILTVTKAPLKVTANDVTWVNDTEWPTFGVTYEGFVLNETESVLTKKPVATTTATKDSAEGTYAITVSGGQATNYTFEYVAGTLTIKKAEDTAVNSMKNSKAVTAVYDLRGRKVADSAASLDELPKGVYIIGGRKVVR